MYQIPMIDHQSHSTEHSIDNQSDAKSEESFEVVEKKIKNKNNFWKKNQGKRRSYVEIIKLWVFVNMENNVFAHCPSYYQSTFQDQVLKKTKPCRRYFSGSCYFGQKCQFLHSQCIDVVEQREFIEKQYKELKLMVPLNPIKLDQTQRFDLQRFHHLYKIFGRKLNFRRDELIINSCRNRLQIFVSICKQSDRFEQLLMSNNTSRKESEQS